MDPDKLLKFFADNLADWSRVTYMTLIAPVSRFALAVVNTEAHASAIAGGEKPTEFWLNPKLLWFAAFSALLGITLNGLLPKRVPAPPLTTAVAVIFGSWFMYGSLIHIVCKLLRGTGHYLHTLTVSMQVSATLYVVVSFLSLLVATLSTVPQISAVISEIPFIGLALVDEPALFFFLIGTVLFSIYQPLALRQIHRFGWLRTAFIGLLPYAFVWLSIAIYHRTGVLPGTMMK
jgi:hypothetical protein